MEESVRLRQRKRTRPSSGEQYIESTIMVPISILSATGWTHGDHIHFEAGPTGEVVMRRVKEAKDDDEFDEDDEEVSSPNGKTI